MRSLAYSALAMSLSAAFCGTAMAAPPFNDNFANVEFLQDDGNQPYPLYTGGSNVDATKQSGEPDHAGNRGGRSVWFQWTAPRSGPAVFETCRSNFDTLLAAYTGTAVNALTAVGARNRGNCGVNGERLRITAAAGTAYKIAIDGYAEPRPIGCPGECPLPPTATGDLAIDVDMPPPPANDLVATAEVLTGASATATGGNRGATKEAGEFDHNGDPGGASVWYRWTAPSNGDVHIDACGSDFDPVTHVYLGSTTPGLQPVGHTAGCPNGRSHGKAAARVIAGETYSIVVDGSARDQTPCSFACGPEELRSHSLDIGTVGLTLTFLPAPSNDDLAAAQPLNGLADTATGSNVGASEEPGEPDHAGNPGGRSVWFRWTAPATGTARLDTCGSGFDTLLAVYTGSNVGGLTPVVSGNGGCGGGDRIKFRTTAGTEYLIAVDGWVATVQCGPFGGFLCQTSPQTGDVVLGLVSAPSPANDQFTAAELLSGSEPGVTGTTLGASNEAGEPAHAGHASGASVWYRWTAGSAAKVAVTTCGSAVNTALAVYTGNSVSGLTPIAGNDNAIGCSPASALSFTPVIGEVYRIAVDVPDADRGGGLGAVKLQLGLAPANDAIADAESVAPAGATVTATNRVATREAGEPAHAGHAGGGSLWYRWTAPRAGVVVIDTCGSAFDTVLAVYTGASAGSLTAVAANADGDGCASGTGASRLTFQPEAGAVYRIAVDGTGGATGDLSLRVRQPDPPVNTVRPAVSGTPHPGHTLTSSNGTWTGRAPIQLSHRWQRCQAVFNLLSCHDIAGATAATYVLTTDDLDHRVRSVVTGVNSDGSSEATAVGANVSVEPANGAPVSTATPTISGEPTFGSVLTVDDGSWTGAQPMSMYYQWLRCTDAQTQVCDEILDATDPSYAVLESDAGSYLRARVGAKNSGGSSSVISGPVGPAGPADAVMPETSITAAPPASTPNSTADFEFSASEFVTSFECALDNDGFSRCESPLRYEGLGPGEHTFRVRAIDSKGNLDATPAEHVWTITGEVVTPPDTTVTAGPSGAWGSTTATFAFTSTPPGATFECALDGAPFAPCVSPREHTALAQGAHAFQVRARNGAAIDESPASRAFTVDTVAPDTTITSGPAGPSTATSATFGFSATEAGSVFECRLEGPGASASFSPCTSPKEYSGLAQGAYTFAVRATDGVGNPDSSPGMSTFSVLAATATPGPGPGPTPTPGLPVVDPVDLPAAVELTGLALTPAAFRAAASGPSARAAVTTGSRVQFTLSEPAEVVFRVRRRLAGRRVAGKCQTQTRANRRLPACPRFVAVAGSFAWSGEGGLNRLRFSGRLGGRRLTPGNYELLATPAAAGRAATGHSRPFRILAAPRR